MLLHIVKYILLLSTGSSFYFFCFFYLYDSISMTMSMIMSYMRAILLNYLHYYWLLELKISSLGFLSTAPLKAKDNQNCFPIKKNNYYFFAPIAELLSYLLINYYEQNVDVLLLDQDVCQSQYAGSQRFEDVSSEQQLCSEQPTGGANRRQRRKGMMIVIRQL